ncbi:MAG: ATP-binding cassette domain-containing protein, partial [Eggerthellaceae bacterium]|nr:ATP-binding cassette domain-containing protein [Eggerthellaceae bacterium]
MSWLESQIEQRRKLDARLTERAYAKLAASVTGPREAPVFQESDLERADGAARIALRYCGAEPGEVPDGVTDVDEYLEHMFAPSGVMRRRVRLDSGWHKRAFGAMIAHLDTGETVALIPRGAGYCYYEPGTGARVRVTASVAERIDSDALLLYRALPARPLTASDLARFMGRVFDASDYLLVVAAALAATLVGMLPAWANQVAFGVVVPSGQADLIAPIGALLVGVAAATVILGACRNLVMSSVSLKLGVACEAAMFSRLLSLPTSFFKQYSSGNLAMRISQVKGLTRQVVTLLLGAGLTCVLSLLYLFQIAVFAGPLVVPAFAVVLVQIAVTVLAMLATARYESATKKADAKLSGTVTALLGGIAKVKLAGAERRAFAKWADDYAPYAQSAYNRPVLVRAAPAITTLVGLLGTAVIYWFAGSAHMNVADYMSFNVAYGQMQVAILALAAMTEEFAQVGPTFDLLEPILAATPEPAASRPVVGSLNGALEVSGVTFRYGPDQPYVLKDLSFSVKPGEYVAIVGKSGCGKSTILRLLLGFEKPERGNVFFDQHDVGKVDLRSLRRHIGTVMQDGKLFMGDILSNITIASPGASLDDAWEAAELAGIAEDIRKMPMGMQTIVTEGSGGISGGQRQRIMIARAVCGGKRVLVFDEATSALDNKTQKHVSDSLDGLNCTRIVVAHRLSTVRHCDRILVVDEG